VRARQAALMPAPDAHPPAPGPIVTPNFLAVMEAVGEVTFPISKRELIEQIGDGTVVFLGRNRDLHDIIKDVHDDYFESEEELRSALERHYATSGEGETEGGVLPTGSTESWQSRVGPGDSGGPAGYLEP
jgi:hypothetical protein